MNFRDLLSKLDNIVEAADPQLYADAQAMMANLEKAAQYNGDDEIVRHRMGLPAKLPPIEQWDGKMPAPIGKPDWVARLTTLGKATDDQNVAVKRNDAISSSRQFITTNMAKLKELVDKLKATMASSQPQDVKESIARQLIESFGYDIDEGSFSQLAGAEKAIQQDIASKKKAADMSAKWAANKATTAAAPAVTQAAQQLGVTGAEKAAGTALAKGTAAGAGKIAGRLIPGVGSAIDAADAYSRWKEGDKTGAAIAGLGALGGLIPGIGGAISLGAMGANQARDYKAGRGALFGPGGELGQGAQASKVYPTTPQDIKAFQQANGLAADGIIGPNTKAVLDKLGYKPASTAPKGVAEDILNFRQRLELIETKARISESLADEYYFDWNGNLYTVDGQEVTDNLTKQVIWESVHDKEVVLDEGVWDKIIGGAASAGRGARDFFKGTAGGIKSPAAAQRLATKPATGTAKSAGLKTGAAIKKNPIKTAAGGAVLGTAAGLGLGGSTPTSPTATSNTAKPAPSGQAAQPTDTAPTAPTAPAAPATTPAAPAGPTPEQDDLIKQIQAIMAQLADIEEQPVMAALQDAQATIDAASKAAAPKDEFAPTATQYGAMGEPPTGQ
jgi:peptidoglycan hydrolase-like protein with peptidoglycan-binding domain